MRVLLIKTLPEPPNNSFNKKFSVGQVFNVFVNNKDNGTAFDIDIKDDPSDFFLYTTTKLLVLKNYHESVTYKALTRIFKPRF